MLLPIRLLWRIKLAPGRRALLTGIFSASLLTTAVSIVHGVYVFSPDRNGEGIWAHVLVSVPARSSRPRMLTALPWHRRRTSFRLQLRRSALSPL